MLRLHDLTRRFGPLTAVDGLNLQINRGEIFGLLGPNGAGKTTTVNMCCGLLRPDSGRVELEGAGSPDRPDVRRRLGVAPQELALYDELTGEENVSFFGRLYGLTGRRLAERTEAALRFVGLFDRRGDRAAAYSGGMKRRLNLAAALVHDPELLILDEPTAGVDPQSRHHLLDNVRELQKQGRTIIYTTHYMEEVQRLCDRVAIVDHGKLIALDTVDNLIAQHGGRSVVVAEGDDGETRLDTDDPLAELARLQTAGRLRRFRVDRPDLESVFLHLTGRKLRD